MKIFGLNISKFSKKNLALPATIKGADIPEDGRSSKVFAESLMNTLAFFGGLQPPNTLVFDYIENASLYNPDFSQALITLVNMANTECYISLKSGEPLSNKQQAIIETLNARCFPDAGNMVGLRKHLFRMLGKFGAISAECEIDIQQRQIRKIWLIKPQNIRFQWDKENSQWEANQLFDGLLYPLSYLTYRYYAMELWDEDKPYAKAPMIAAIEAILRQMKIFENIDFYIEKLGLLGILDLAIKIPEKGNETDAQYLARLIKYRDDMAAEQTKHKRDGVTVHYDDVTLNVKPVSGSSANIKDIHDINEEQLCSGANLPAAMMGRPYSQTETFAEVMYRIVTSQCKSTQRFVAQYLEYLYGLEFALHGDPSQIMVEFDDPLPLDIEKEARAESLKLANIQLKQNQGWIDADTAAQEAGYQKAYSEPMMNISPFGMGGLSKLSHRHQNLPNLSMSKLAGGGNRERAIRKLIQKYIASLGKMSDKVQKQISGLIEEIFLNATQSSMSPDDFAKSAMSAIDTKWASADWSKSNELCEDIYKEMLLNPALPTQYAAEDITISFGGASKSVAEFVNKLQTNLMTTLWADPERTENKALLSYLKEQYLDKGADIFGRRDPEAAGELRKEFSEQLGHLADYQINRIVDTGIQRARSWSSIDQYHQAGFEVTRIDELEDCCHICAPFQGKIVRVELAYNNMVKQSKMSDEDYIDHLRSNVDLISEAQRKEEENEDAWNDRVQEIMARMEDRGVALPPYHPNCRGATEVSLEDIT